MHPHFEQETFPARAFRTVRTAFHPRYDSFERESSASDGGGAMSGCRGRTRDRHHRQLRPM